MTTTAFARFAPALQPTHAKELILMLQEIEAVGVTRLRKTSRPGRSWARDILYCDRREENQYKCSDWSMEVELSALYGNYDKQTNRPTIRRRTDMRVTRGSSVFLSR